jgi:hypothetical protein
MTGFKPFFKINDKGEHINIMSVGMATVTKEEVRADSSCRASRASSTAWKVSLQVYPGGNTIELTGEYAEKFVEEYTSVPMGKNYL